MSDNGQPAIANSGFSGTTYHEIDGWLMIPAYWQPILRIAANIYVTLQTLTLYSTQMRPASQAYILVLLVVCIGMAFAWGRCGYLAYSIKPVFPKAYIWTSIADVVSSVLLTGGGYALLNIFPVADVGILTAAALWIPYMLLSKRVKATFDGVPMPPTTAR